MAETVYVLCALASGVCAFLLARGFRRSRTRLLLWSSLCFGCLTINNILLFFDKVIVREVDLGEARSAVALAGLLVLLYGLIWDAE